MACRSCKVLPFILLILLLGALVLGVALFGFGMIYFEEKTGGILLDDESGEYFAFDDSCNVVGLQLVGALYTYPPFFEEEGSVSADSLLFALGEASENEDIKAILLEIDSPGGTPVAAEEIARALRRVEKPTVVQIREIGTSAAYWVATGADTIFAARSSDVGGIGVTASYLDTSQHNEREGFTYNEITSAPFKDYLNPDKELTEAERALVLRDIGIIHEHFVDDVALYRNMEREDVERLADGSSLPGSLALEAGLIDELGDYYDVRMYLEELLGEEIEVCWQ